MDDLRLNAVEAQNWEWNHKHPYTTTCYVILTEPWEKPGMISLSSLSYIYISHSLKRLNSGTWNQRKDHQRE